MKVDYSISCTDSRNGAILCTVPKTHDNQPTTKRRNFFIITVNEDEHFNFLQQHLVPDRFAMAVQAFAIKK